MTKITFLSADAAHYNFLYEVLASSTGYRGAAARVVSKIFDKMESLGEYGPTPPLYVLKSPGTVELEDAEFKILKECLDKVEVNALGTKQFIKTLDWLDSLDK